ncbi:MAG: mucoidy inhibitor MuiA family protein, partial [Cytophagales bacterium]|nr:mucoidy inhibitor MuiA family protein [Cytophagales bacterium]
LLLEGMPAALNTQSIQVKGEGNFTVLSVLHQLNYLNGQTKVQEIKDLESRLETLRERKENESGLLSVYGEEEEVLMENKRLGSQNQAVKVSDLREAADFYRARLAELKSKQLEKTRSIKGLDAEMGKIDRQLQELRARKDEPTGEIVISVNAKTATAARFVVSYLVNEAGWRPTYDIRVKDVSSPVALVYKANVHQTSGENWKDVKLTLSTGDPAQSGSQPVLNPWYLGFYRPVPAPSWGDANATATNVRQVTGRVTDEGGQALPGVNVVIKGTTVGTVTDAGGGYSLQVPPGASAVVYSFIGFMAREMPIHSPVMNVALQPDIASLSEVVVTGYGVRGSVAGVQTKPAKEKAVLPAVATQEVKQTSVSFRIDIPYSIPSDGKQYAVDMQEYDIPAYYQYSCVPKLDTDAFLTAKITGWEEYNLLAGEANLFFEGTYLGKSLLDVGQTTDTLTLSLGRDKNITVSRTKVEAFASKQFIGANRRDAKAWEITIRNKKAQPVNLVVYDQFPVSTQSEITVERQEAPGAAIDETTGKLTWQFTLPPAGARKLNVGYTVKYPKNERLVLE